MYGHQNKSRRSSIIQYFWTINRSSRLYVCLFSSYLFWTSSSLDVPAGVTQEEGHTGFLIHLPSAVRALIFLARRIQPFLSLVDHGTVIGYREIQFKMRFGVVFHFEGSLQVIDVKDLKCTCPLRPICSYESRCLKF